MSINVINLVEGILKLAKVKHPQPPALTGTFYVFYVRAPHWILFYKWLWKQISVSLGRSGVPCALYGEKRLATTACMKQSPGGKVCFLSFRVEEL